MVGETNHDPNERTERVNWDGRREVLGAEQANRESARRWKDFLLGPRKRGLHGVRLVITDSHAGLRKAVREVLPEARWQRCYVHFLRDALDQLRDHLITVLHSQVA